MISDLVAHSDAGAPRPRLPDGLHLHVQAGEEPAGDVEGDVAAVLVALDASANLDSQVEAIQGTQATSN